MPLLQRNGNFALLERDGELLWVLVTPSGREGKYTQGGLRGGKRLSLINAPKAPLTQCLQCAKATHNIR